MHFQTTTLLPLLHNHLCKKTYGKMSPNHCLTLSYFNTGPEGYILSSPEAEGSRAHLLFLGLSIVISEVSGKSFGQGCDE